MRFSSVISTPGIPKRLHQIWLGGKPIPKRWADFSERLRQMHPAWEYRLWTDADLPELFAADPFKLERHFDRCPNFGFQSDLMRLMILWQVGGVYLDTDCEPLRPLDGLQESLDAFVGATFSPQPMKEVQIENAVMAFAPRHPFLKSAIGYLAANLSSMADNEIRPDMMNVVLTTGPGFLSERLAEYRKVKHSTQSDVAVIPGRAFYPITPGKEPLTEPQAAADYPGSLLIHHWDGSWIRQRYRGQGPVRGYYGYTL